MNGCPESRFPGFWPPLRKFGHGSKLYPAQNSACERSTWTCDRESDSTADSAHLRNRQTSGVKRGNARADDWVRRRAASSYV